MAAYAIGANGTGTQVAVIEPAALPATLAEDRPILSFAEVAKRDPALATRLREVAQRELRAGTITSLEAAEHVTRRILAAADPADATRFDAIVNRKDLETRSVALWEEKSVAFQKRLTTVGSYVADGVLFPFLAPGVTAGAGIALAVHVTPWALIPMGAAALVHAVASCRYYAANHGWWKT